jgi:hypothetical protein
VTGARSCIRAAKRLRRPAAFAKAAACHAIARFTASYGGKSAAPANCPITGRGDPYPHAVSPACAGAFRATGTACSERFAARTQLLAPTLESRKTPCDSLARRTHMVHSGDLEATRSASGKSGRKVRGAIFSQPGWEDKRRPSQSAGAPAFFQPPLATLDMRATADTPEPWRRRAAATSGSRGAPCAFGWRHSTCPSSRFERDQAFVTQGGSRRRPSPMSVETTCHRPAALRTRDRRA